jgi:predicted RNase H-like nuclease (RuvC/YqgF family)
MVVALGFLVWKRALLDVQSKAMQVQADALEVYETRISQLEAAVGELKAENQRLQGIIEGKDSAVTDLVEAIASANVCLNAASCANRVVPSA